MPLLWLPGPSMVPGLTCALCLRLQDSHQSDLEGGAGPSTSGRRVALPYTTLYEALSQQMVTEQATLLLYTLLHGCR
jgi:hypothetical protein